MSPTILVIPCYNEAARLDERAFLNFVDGAEGIDLLCVDDGSTDETGTILERLEAQRPGRIAALTLPRNMGKAEAVRRGFLAAFDRHPTHVGFWDADLATPLEDAIQFRAFLDSRPDLEAVFGSRVNLLGRHVRRGLLRHYVGRVFATLAVLALGIPIYDTQCGAKLFRASDRLRSVFEKPFGTRWVFDVEIIARMAQVWDGRGVPHVRDMIFEMPLMVWRDVKGSKIRMTDFFRVGMDLMYVARTYPRTGR